MSKPTTSKKGHTLDAIAFHKMVADVRREAKEVTAMIVSSRTGEKEYNAFVKRLKAFADRLADEGEVTVLRGGVG